MKPSVAIEIQQLRARLGPSDAGKWIQRLLALTFVKAGRPVGDERTVEGPDLLVGRAQIEVKTSDAAPFTLGEKDFADVTDALAKGLTPLVALLETGRFDGWVIARADGLGKGALYPRDLALRRDRELERDARAHFDAVVQAWAVPIRQQPDVAFELMDERRREGRWQP